MPILRKVFLPSCHDTWPRGRRSCRAQPTCSPSALYTAALFDTVGKEGSQSARYACM